MVDSVASKLTRTSLITGLVVILALSLSGNTFFALIERRLSDIYDRILGEQTPDDSVVIIEIDDKTLEYYFPEIPLPRGQIALLLDQLAGPVANAKTVAFDLYFEGPDKLDPAWDTLLSMITAIHKDRMVGAVFFSEVGNGTGGAEGNQEIVPRLQRFSYSVQGLEFPEAAPNNLPLSLLMDSASFYGHINVYQDETGVFRELPLFIKCGGTVISALGVEALVNFLDIDRANVKINGNHLKLGNYALPLNQHGTLKFRHFGPLEKYQRYSLIDLLEAFESGEVQPNLFEGKIVLVGINSKTYYPNEYSFSSFGYERPNVYIHADVINSILKRRYLKDVQASLLPILSTVLGLLFITIHFLGERKLRLIVSIGSMILLVALDFILFSRGLLLQLIPLLTIAIPLTVYTYFVSYSEQAEIIVAQEKEALSLRAKEASLIAIEKEIKVGRAIQERLLPQTIPEIAGFDIYGTNLPAKGVSGDFYDFLQIDDNHWAIMVADVSGKGISAALLMAASQTVLRSESLRLKEYPGDCTRAVGAANDLVFAITGPSHFLTLFYLILDPGERVIKYANAGNNPPIHVQQDGTTTLLGSGDLILGALPGTRYQTNSMELGPSEKLVIFTDGPSDAVNEAGEFYGEERLRNMVGKCHGLSSQQMTEAIVEDIKSFIGSADQADDITIVIVGRN